MKTAAIIQARMGSARLPGKMLMTLAGVPVIQWVYDRARRIEGVDDVLVATTVSAQDDTLADYCHRCRIPFFRGSENDVLDRYCRAARQFQADVIIRVTGDCPLLDPCESGKVLALFRATPGCDYASNVHPPFLPDGLDTEVVRLEALAGVWREVCDPVAHEHVTWHICRHPERFRLAALAPTAKLDHLRWTLDRPEDYSFLSAVAERLRVRGEFGYLREVLAILRDEPELQEINRHIERNEGLKASLAGRALLGMAP